MTDTKKLVVAKLEGKIVCPECGKEIFDLKLYEGGEQYSTVCLQDDLNLYAQVEEFIHNDSKEDDYECPECCEVLCHTEEDAIKILKGEPISNPNN